MREVSDDIWNFQKDHWIVITTNLGWNTKGENIMGAGLAKQAADRFPHLPAVYGKLCKAFGNEMGLVFDSRLILFPTKSLDEANPHLSWKQNSSLELIEKGLKQLSSIHITQGIAVPLLGTLNGKLSKDEVLPLMRKYLRDSKYVIVHPVVRKDEHPF